LDFDRWDLADNDGRTVAHEVAQRRYLPRGFDRWDMADRNGWTVAHDAARRMRWNGGRGLAIDVPDAVLLLEDAAGKRVADVLIDNPLGKEDGEMPHAALYRRAVELVREAARSRTWAGDRSGTALPAEG
jgi:hypothetical protein